MRPIPPDYYRSEEEDLPHDSDYGITQPFHCPAVPGANAERDCSTTETDHSWDPPTPTGPRNNSMATANISTRTTIPVEGEETDTSGQNQAGSGSGVDLAEILGFSPPDFRTPPWQRAEEAGMSPISPWRETCDISPSRRPPPSRSGPRRRPFFSNPPPHRSTPTFPGPAHREPLATLYERDPYASAEVSCEESMGLPVQMQSEMKEVGGNTDPLPLEHPPTVDVGCQTSAEHATDPFPHWLDGAIVENELRCGRERRLREYMMRFRYSAVAHHTDHQRAFVDQSVTRSRVTEDLESPSSGKRPRLERRTKADAKDKIKSCFEPGSILDSQIDSQVWLEAVLHARTLGSESATSSAELQNPSTPNRNQNSRYPLSPFTPNVPDGKTPRRFSEQLLLTKSASKHDRFTVPPGHEFSYEDLDWLTEYYLRLNAGLTEHMVSLHVRLHQAEDKVVALEKYIEKNL